MGGITILTGKPLPRAAVLARTPSRRQVAGCLTGSPSLPGELSLERPLTTAPSRSRSRRKIAIIAPAPDRTVLSLGTTRTPGNHQDKRLLAKAFGIAFSLRP